MKKISLLIFTILTILTPIFFCSATGETLISSNVTTTSADLNLSDLTSSSTYTLTLIKDSDSTIIETDIFVADFSGMKNFNITKLVSNTSYTASLYTGFVSTKLATNNFKTKAEVIAPAVIVNVFYLSSTSVRLDVSNFPPNTKGQIFVKNDTNNGNTDTYLDGNEFTSGPDGSGHYTFDNLKTNSAYIGGVNVPLAGGDNDIVSVKFTPTASSPTLNFVDLVTTINSAVSRIKNNIEGTDIGNYGVGSIAELRKVVDEKYNAVTGTFLPNAFADQTQIDAYNKKLNDAIVIFEARRIGAKASTTDLSSKKGGLVPACPATGCGFNQLMELINNVITFLLFTVATPLAAIIIAYAGWLYLGSGGSSENISKAKKILKNVVIGYIIGLAAWLIVKTIITSLGVDPSINTFLK